MSVTCLKGHTGRFTNHGPNVGQGWWCPECKDDIEHSDNTYGSSAKMIVKQTGIEKRPNVGDQINCTKTPCSACRGVYRNVDPKIIFSGDVVTCNNTRGIKDLELAKSYEVVAVEPKGLRIRLLKDGAWVNMCYSRCRFIWGGKL